MFQRLKSILLKISIIIMVISVMGIPSLYHHCSLRGDHNWQSCFLSDFHKNHCICCEDVENEHDSSCSECSSSCCEKEQKHQDETVFSVSKCCNIEVISLQVVATEYFAKQQFKQLLNFIACFDIPCQNISTGIIPSLKFLSPLPYSDFSPPRADTFLFSQFLL